MAITKNKVVIIAAGTSNGAGSTTNGTEVNLSTAAGGELVARITNGATGPTVGADVVVYSGGATTEKYEAHRATASTSNAAVTDFVFDVPPGRMFLNVSVTGNTGQPVTCDVFLEELTTI